MEFFDMLVGNQGFRRNNLMGGFNMPQNIGIGGGFINQPSLPEGLLGEQATEDLRKRSIGSGLLNAIIGYAAMPKNENLGLGRILAGAAQQGLAGARGVYDQAGQDLFMQQRLGEMQRKQEQQQALQGMIGEIADPNERLLAQLAPEKFAESRLRPAESPFGKVDIKDFTPESIAVYNQTKNPASLRKAVADPDADKLTNLINIRDKLSETNPNNPNIKVYTDAINKLTQFPPAASTVVNVGQGGVAPKKIDEKFADQFIDWTVGGGFSDVQKSLTQLEGAISILETAPEGSITGKAVGLTPPDVLKLSNPQAVATKEAVEEIVQRNLRLILGAQFTEKEGERLIARAYNPALSQTENVRRGRLLQQQIFEAARAKQDAVEFYNENGTIFGWKGKLFNNTNDFLSEYDKRVKGKETPSAPSAEGFKIKRIR